MKKKTVTISLNEKKLAAIRQYLSEKGSGLDDELTVFMDELYEKHVPENVRQFIAERSQKKVGEW